MKLDVPSSGGHKNKGVLSCLSRRKNTQPLCLLTLHTHTTPPPPILLGWKYPTIQTRSLFFEKAWMNCGQIWAWGCSPASLHISFPPQLRRVSFWDYHDAPPPPVARQDVEFFAIGTTSSAHTSAFFCFGWFHWTHTHTHHTTQITRPLLCFLKPPNCFL